MKAEMNIHKLKSRKFFVVAVQSDPRTRWIEPDTRLRDLIAILVRSLVKSTTAGPEPEVVVHVTESNGNTSYGNN